MRKLRQLFWATTIALCATGSLQAQGVGGATGGITGGGTTGGTGTGGGFNNITTDSSLVAAPVISGSTINTANQGVQSSNAFANYFGNPLFQGRIGATVGGGTDNVPGGFGAALYPTSTGGGGTGGLGGIGGAAGGRTGTTTAAGGRAGGTTGTAAGIGGATAGLGGGIGGLGGGIGGLGGGIGGLGGNQLGGRGGALGGQFGGIGGNQLGGRGGALGGNQLGAGGVPRINYTSTVKFDAPALTSGMIQTQLRTVLTSSAVTPFARGLNVTVADGGIVTLTGVVPNADESRFVEGMIRVTPGVRQVNNELTIQP